MFDRRKCKRCGKSFLAHIHNQVFCCSQCQKTYNKNKLGKDYVRLYGKEYYKKKRLKGKESMRVLSDKMKQLRQEVLDKGIVSYHIFYERVFRFGWDVEKAMTTPPKIKQGRVCKNFVFYKQKMWSINDALRDLCLDVDIEPRKITYHYRMKKNGQTLQQAFDHIVKLYHRKYKRREL